jgi:putative SOS response-associated peptidase YedK
VLSLTEDKVDGSLTLPGLRRRPAQPLKLREPRLPLATRKLSSPEQPFDSVSGDEDWSPRYNIAPTQRIPVIRQNPKEPIRELSLVRWGLIPSWAKDPSVAVKMINAKSETAATNQRSAMR